MNRKEFLESGSYSTYYYKVQKLLKDWKLENNITERCVVHHRDDTEECIKYNNAHYELWGFNEDDTFEFGKYVQFMTATEHAHYHHIGNKNHVHGKHVSEEAKDKISIALKGENHHFYGKHHSDETKLKMSLAHKDKKLSDEAKAKISAINKGKQFSEEHRTKLRQNHADFSGEKAPFYGRQHSEETKIKMHENMNAIKFLYNTYKNNGGIKTWNEFQKALKTGDITFSDYKLTIIN